MSIMKKNKCCIPPCKGDYIDLGHKFPFNKERAMKWLEAIDCPRLKNIPLHKLNTVYYVCSRHFRIEDYKHSQSRSLNMNAIPSLNLKQLNELHLARNPTPRECKGQNILLVSRDEDDFEVNSSDEDFHGVDAIAVENTEAQSTPAYLGDHQSRNESVKEKTEESEILSTVFEIEDPRYGKLCLNPFWLRCHCQCAICYNEGQQRIQLNFLDVPESINSKSVHQIAGTDILSIEWGDGHKSEYDVNVLFESNMKQDSHSFSQTCWQRFSQNIASAIDFNQFVIYDDTIRQIFQNLTEYGFTVIKSVPTQTNAMANFTLCRLFPHLESIQFNERIEMHTGICTNITYDSADCGLKCYFITQNIKLILVDGLNVAHTLKKLNADAFTVLNEVKAPLEVNGNGVKWKIAAPIIEFDPETEEIRQLRLDVHRIVAFKTLPQDRVKVFYDSLKLMIELVQNEENQRELILKPGMIVILDNWRVFHRLISNTATMTCYVERKDFVGRSLHFGL